MSAALETSELSADALSALLKDAALDLHEVVSKRLFDGRSSVRRNAAHALALLGDKTTIPADVAHLLPVAGKDTDPIVRAHVMAALAHPSVAPEIAIPGLLNGLVDREDAVSDAAVASLDKLAATEDPARAAAILELLIDAAGDMRPFVQVTAVSLVVQRGAAAVPALIDALRADRGPVRKAARQCLRMLGTVAADALIDALPDDELRDTAKRILDGVALTEAHEKKLKALVSKGAPVVQMVARRLLQGAKRARDKALERPPVIEIDGFSERPLTDKERKAAAKKLGKALDAPLLLRALRDARPAVQQNAVALLGDLGIPDDLRDAAVASLSPLVQAPAEAVRLAAVELLGTLPTADAGRLLLRAVADRSQAVTDAARAGLAKLAAAAPAALLGTLAGGQAPIAREAAIAAVVGAGAAGAKAAAQVLAEHVSEPVREAACEVLGRLGAGAAKELDGLLAALTDHDENVRAKAAWAVGEVAPRDDAKALEALQARKLADSAPQVRQAASRARDRVRGVEPPPTVGDVRELPLPGFDDAPLEAAACAKAAKKMKAPHLVPLLFDGRWVVRANAATCLGALGKASHAFVEQLCIAVKDPDARVQRAAAASLATLKVAPAQVVPVLADALRTADEETTEALFAALDAYGKAVVEPLLGMLGGRGERVAATVGRVAAHAPGLVVGPLSKLLTDGESVVVRENAADLLAALGPQAAKAEGALLKALEERSVLFRVKVLGALGKVAKPDSEAVLEALKALKKEDQRMSVQQALGEAQMWLRSRARK